MLHEIDTDEMFDLVDRDGDGTINKIEFRWLILYIIYFMARWDAFEQIRLEPPGPHGTLQCEWFPEACALVGIRADVLHLHEEFDSIDVDG